MSLEKQKLNKFLKALDTLTQDYICKVCSELCKDPITLSTCFHIICSEHFATLKKCPTCDIPLSGCNTYKDKGFEESMNATKQLNTMFEGFRNENLLRSSKEEASNNTNRKPEKKQDQLHETTENVNKISQNSIKADKKSKNNVKSLTTLEKVSSKRDFNSTISSTASSKVNKGLDKRNKKGETSLHLACRLGKVDTVVDLLKQGAITNTKDNAGWTPLHEAVHKGSLELVKILLQHNTLLNVPGPDNETPLHEAVRYNHKEIAKVLVKNGADSKAINCKGETPMQLASTDMRKILEEAADNISQCANVTFIPEPNTDLDSEDIEIYCVSQDKSVHNKLKLLSKCSPNIQIRAKFTKNVTHLIVDSDDELICTSSLDILQGIVNGILILSSLWVTKSYEKKLEPFHKYEIRGVGNISYNGPKNSRYNKYKQLPGIFNGCHFYLHNFNTEYEISKGVIVTKAILTKLILDAGGVVLRRVPNPELIPEEEKLLPYHANRDGKLVNCSHYIIFKDMYEPMYNMSHIKALPVGWLIECLEKYELCEPWSAIRKP